MRGQSLVRINWSYVPSIEELEQFLSLTYESHPYYAFIPPSPGYRPPVFYCPFKFRKDDCIVHNTNRIDAIINLYESSGFETHVLLEDPFGHRGPTVACPLGFPSNLPKQWRELKRFNRWICRVHVDITHLPQDGRLVSAPHIEPDPRFHALAHLWDTYIHGNLVRGRTAVEVLRWLLGG